MKVFGVEFVPLNEPLKNRLEALAAGLWYVTFAGLLPLGIWSTVYLLFFTRYWPIVCVYLFWIWVIDRNASEEGDRRSHWLRSLTFFRYTANYFPITVKTVPEFTLDPKRNYLSCAFPHGYLPIGATIVFQTNALGVETLFPNHHVSGTTFKQSFSIPIFREYLLGLGVTSSTPKAINSLLSHPDGGKIAAIFVGGSAESFHCHDGQYRLILKNRKGFAKLAIKNGTPIIPVFAFGQNSNFKQIVFQEGSFLQRIQAYLKKATGFAFPILYGRGLLQYSFGWIPLQKPINIIIGSPIEVIKNENPAIEDIDLVHQTFVDKLSELFEEYKYEYEENPDDCKLIIS